MSYQRAINDLVEGIPRWISCLDSIETEIKHHEREVRGLKPFGIRTKKYEVNRQANSMSLKEDAPGQTMTQRLTRMFLNKPSSHQPTVLLYSAQSALKVQNQLEYLEETLDICRRAIFEDVQLRKLNTIFDESDKWPKSSGKNRLISSTNQTKEDADASLEHIDGLNEQGCQAKASSQYQGEPSNSLNEEVNWSTPDGLERIRRNLRKGNSSSTFEPDFNRILQWCQTSCQQAAYHFQRDESCSAEITDIRKRLAQLRNLVAVMVSREENNKDNDRDLDFLATIENTFDAHDTVTDDPYDPKNHIRIAHLLDQAFDRRDTIGSSRMVEDSLRTLLRLSKNDSLTVCKWEAPEVFREWYHSMDSCSQLNTAEKSAAFQNTLLVLGFGACFETTTLIDYVTRQKDDGTESTRQLVLDVVIEALLYAIERDRQNGIAFQTSEPLETTYVWHKEDETIYQLFLLERYIILASEEQNLSFRAASGSLLRICQALRCQPGKIDNREVENATSTSVETASIQKRQFIQFSVTMERIFGTGTFKAWSISPLQQRSVTVASCWTSLFNPSPIVVENEPSGEYIKGLKIPFDLMVHLAAVETITMIAGQDETTEQGGIGTSTNASLVDKSDVPTFENSAQSYGIVLSGFFTALVPIDVHEGFVRWHLEYTDPSNSKSESEVELIDPYKLQSTKGSWFRTTNYETLRKSKCILGWWNEASILLGTKELDNNVRFSKPSATISRSLHLSEVSALGQFGTSTVIPLNIQGAATFQFVNNVQHFGKEDMYTMALMKMANDIALVYDAEADRGWLVPKLSLILHMSHSYCNTVLGIDASLDPIPYAEPSSDGAAAALKALRGKGGTILYKGDSDGDIILRNVLATLHANICEANKTREPSKPGKLLATQYLNMVEEPAAGSNITVTKTPSSMKAWHGIIDGVGCVMVCAGLGEAIEPATIGGKCTKGCNRLPCAKGYLAAHFWCLGKLLERRGWDLNILGKNPVSINDDQTWALQGDMFKGCMMDKDHLSRWDNKGIQLQQVVKKRWNIRRTPCEHRPAPPVTGAAVFGIPGGN